MLESGWSDNLFDNFLIGCSCIIGTCSWFTHFLSLPVSHSIVLSLVTLFLCIHEMMVIFQDHSDIKSSAPPLRQCSFYSSYFLWGNYFPPSSSAPISVLSFQSNSSFFLSCYQGGARIGHLQTHMNESGPADFGLFTEAYWLSVWRNDRRERWEIHRWEGRTLNISHY